MTVARLLSEMSVQEFFGWCQYFDDKARRADPNAPQEIDWENVTPQNIGALFGIQNK